MNNKKILIELEKLVRKYDETLFDTNTNGEYKLAPSALESIAKAWKRMSQEDRYKTTKLICNNIEWSADDILN